MAELGERFGERKLHQSPDAPIRHFSPVKVEEGIPRDRFDNRIFTSSTKGYTDREGQETKAGLLVSRQGEHFLRENSGILQTIDRGLNHFEAYPSDKEELVLSEEVRIKRLDSGRQSDVYLLTSGKEKYVLKKKTSAEGPSQPYINEMLQCQEIATELSEDLNEANVAMPAFLFASGQLSCTRFEEGTKPTAAVVHAAFSSLLPSMDEYIKNKNISGVALWKDIEADVLAYFGFTPIGLKTDNFVLREDNKLAWIDPFIYQP